MLQIGSWLLISAHREVHLNYMLRCAYRPDVAASVLAFLRPCRYKSLSQGTRKTAPAKKRPKLKKHDKSPWKSTALISELRRELQAKKAEYLNDSDEIRPRGDQRYKKELHKVILPNTSSQRNEPRTSSRKWKKSEQREAILHEPKLERLINPAQAPFVAAKDLEPDALPRLHHGLDRVLFSPGVHFLQDPRTRLYNFTPYLKRIVSHKDFDFKKVQAHVLAGKDDSLMQECLKHNKSFYSSTSSMTQALLQFYLFLNRYSAAEDSKHRFPFPEFTHSMRSLPATLIVEPKAEKSDGGHVWSVTSDKSNDVELILSKMGHCLETLLTTDENEFKNFLISENADKETSEEYLKAQNVYNYLMYGDFLMRSQLDCYDNRLPGNGTFDIKTRAVCAVRYDRALEPEQSTYQIWKSNGRFESFERETNDLIRSGAMLKYGFQARIGQMDGIFLAYHNLNSFFGFQYIPLGDIDEIHYSDSRMEVLSPEHGNGEVNLPATTATAFAENQFKMSLLIWEDLMKQVIEDLKGTEHDGQAFRLVFKWVKSSTENAEAGSEPAEGESNLRVYAVPLGAEKVAEIQSLPVQLHESIKGDVTHKAKKEALEEYQLRLNSFNEQLAADMPVLAYTVKAWPKGRGRAQHPYPTAAEPEVSWNYTITRHVAANGQLVEPLPAHMVRHYVSLMKKCTSMLTLSYHVEEDDAPRKPRMVTELRRYSDVGRERLKQWGEWDDAAKAVRANDLHVHSK